MPVPPSQIAETTLPVASSVAERTLYRKKSPMPKPTRFCAWPPPPTVRNCVPPMSSMRLPLLASCVPTSHVTRRPCEDAHVRRELVAPAGDAADVDDLRAREADRRRNGNVDDRVRDLARVVRVRQVGAAVGDRRLEAQLELAAALRPELRIAERRRARAPDRSDSRRSGRRAAVRRRCRAACRRRQTRRAAAGPSTSGTWNHGSSLITHEPLTFG